MYIHPRDFKRGYAMFSYYFGIWVQGYNEWGKEDFSAIFIKDPSVKRGLIMYCPDGLEGVATKISIQTISSSL